jgi:pilus assembly protein CpaB
MRVFLVIIAAMFMAGGTGYYLLVELRPPQQPVETVAVVAEVPSTDVFAPAKRVGAGTLLKPEDLVRMPMQESAITSEMVAADEVGTELLVGSVARQTLAEGVPIARSATVRPGDRGFLAAVLPKGKRAISIPITEVAGISGLVMPGDRVDIILTYSVQGDIIDAGRDIRASETVLTNLRILALDQRMGSGTTVAGEVNAAAGTQIPIARTATLEVTPEEAEIMTLATSLGELSLVLNSVSDGGPELEYRDTGDASPLHLAAASMSRAPLETLGRSMTLDSDVTSLLQRDVTVPAGETPGQMVDPLPDRTMRVQIVRGTSRTHLQLRPEAAAQLAAAAYPAQPATPLE